MRLLLVRHGETEWNSEQRYIGSTDHPLSENGLQQANALARRLKDEGVDVIYTSDYQRAAQTAFAIASMLQMPAIEDRRLRELDFGRWEGLTMADIQERYAEALAIWQEDPQASPPDGESLAHLEDRVRSLLEELRDKHPDETVALVAHGGTFQILLFVALDIPLRNGWYFYMYNGALSELLFHEGRAALVYLNDTHHLADPCP